MATRLSWLPSILVLLTGLGQDGGDGGRHTQKEIVDRALTQVGKCIRYILYI